MTTRRHRRPNDLPAARLGSDTRGAQLVEYVLLVGLVALLAVAGFRVFGETATAKAEAQARCVESLSCGGAVVNAAMPGRGAKGPPPPPPTQGSSAGPVAGASGGASQASATATQAQRDLAKSLVKAGGSATQADVDAVAADVARMPRPVLEYMQAKGISVVAAKGSVTDYMTHLKGVRPRGWPPGSGWDTVPGTVNHGNEVVIATHDGKVPATGDGHGAYSLTIHETFHAIDFAGGWSKDPEFAKARDADAANLDAYLKQPGEAGLQEAFAESAAHYFAGDEAWGKARPNVWQYWSTHAGKIRKP
jgi:Flp pilus assembly pilin Flp